MRKLVLSLVFTLLSVPLLAQEQQRPKDWKVRFDRANAQAADHKFVTMTPGWHVTTGPAGIMYNPSSTAKGDFRLESEIFTFPTGGRDREAFGILFGGKDLAGENQSYTYFLIRNDGRFLVKRRDGSATANVVSWTPHDAIVKNMSETENAKNVLAVEAGATNVDFYINGAKVTSVPRADIQVDGIVGLRVNHGLNLHISSLKVMPKETG